MGGADRGRDLARCGVATHAGPMERFGAKGAGTSVYFRDPEGSLMEFISYSGGEYAVYDEPQRTAGMSGEAG